MLYPQNGDRIVATDTVTSLHPMYTSRMQHDGADTYTVSQKNKTPNSWP